MKNSGVRKIRTTSAIIIGVVLLLTLCLVNLYAAPVTVGNFVVDYVISSSWGTGATINVTLKNNGPAINGWTVGWTFPGNQTITSMWNASYTQSGASVSAKDAGYNAPLSTGGSTSFGFNINYSGTNAAPTSFTVNSSTTNPTPTRRGATSTPTRRGSVATPTPTKPNTPTPTQGGSGGTKTITSTIIVAAGQTYDGGNQTIICQGMGDGSQAEDQDPVFRLENGASLRNVIIGFPGCDGVHCYGNNNVNNVRWVDIGEDALTVKGGDTANAGTITVDGGYANKGDDKVFQVNAPCTLRISNFSADTMGKLCRQNGDTTFTMTLYLTNVTCKNVKEAIFRTDSSTSQCYYRNLTVTNFNGSKGWWYGRDSQAHAY